MKTSFRIFLYRCPAFGMDDYLFECCKLLQVLRGFYLLEVEPADLAVEIPSKIDGGIIWRF